MDKKWRKSIFQLLPLDGRYFLNVALNRCLAVSIEEKLVVLNLMNRLTAKSETLVILLIYLKFTKKKKKMNPCNAKQWQEGKLQKFSPFVFS